MTTATQGSNPLLIVDVEAEETEANEWRGKPLGDIEKAVKESRADMEKVINQARGEDGSFDLARCDFLSGADTKEKFQAAQKMHNTLAGRNKALTETKVLANSVELIERANRDGLGDLSGPNAIAGENGESPLVPMDIFTEGMGRIIRPTNKITAMIKARGFEDFRSFLGDNDEKSIVNLGEINPSGKGMIDHIFETRGGPLTLADADPAEHRLPFIVPSSQRPPQITDLIPEFRALSDTVEYLREKTFNNPIDGAAAAFTTDGDAVPESDLDFDLIQAQTQRVGVRMPVTESLLMDIPQMGNYLNNRMPFKVAQAYDYNIVNGKEEGTANQKAKQFSGLLNTADTNTQVLTTAAAAGGEPNRYTNLFEELYSALNKVGPGGGYMNPTGFIFENKLWVHIVTRETSSAGFYYGPPGEMWAMRLFGYPVRITSAVTYGASKKIGVIADFISATALAVREGLSMQMGRNGDDFGKYQWTLRAAIRAALLVYNPKGLTIISNPANNIPNLP